MDNKREIVTEALRHTEMYIADTLHLGLAADQRAMTFAGLAAAIAAILTGLAENASLPIVMYLGAVGTLVGSGLAVYSCRPQKFHICGHSWDSWRGHVNDNDDVVDVLISQLEENDNRIENNFKSLEKSASIFKSSIYTTFASLLGTMVVQLILHVAS